MTSPATSTVPRRTQAERRESTQTRLLDATLACLIESGYAGATTAKIESRASASRGARLHYFPTKAALVSAAVAHLFEGIAARYDRAMSEVAPDANRFRAGLRLLADTFAEPAHAAVLELFVAARTDPELREQLRETSARLHQLVRMRANEYFPNLARREASGLLEAIQATLSGLALRSFVFGETKNQDQVLDLIEHMIETTFDAPGSTRRNVDG